MTHPYFRLKRPCKDCPFRSDRPGFLTSPRAGQIADDLLTGNMTFTCHKTIDYEAREEEFDEDGEDAGEDDIDYAVNKMCAGAEIFVEKQGAANAALQIAQRLGLRDPKRLDMDAPVFDSKQAFMDAQPR